MAVPIRHPEPGSAVLHKWMEERRMARAIEQRKQHAQRLFAGAGINRFTASLLQSSQSVNSDLDSALVIMRSRARDLCANYDYARRVLTLYAINIVGPEGPTLQVRATNPDGTLDSDANDAIEWHWWKWMQICDVRGMQTLPQMLQTKVKGVVRDGESLLRFVRDREVPYGMQLQLLEPDRLDESINRKLDNGNLVRMGVEINSRLRPVAYWIFTQHPGENYQVTGSREHERIPARDLLHAYVNERAEQVRGYSMFHAVLMRAAQNRGYEEAAVIAARLGASKMGFFTRTEVASTEALAQIADRKAADGTLQMDAEPGEFRELPLGVGFETFNPDYPHEMFGEFVRSNLRGFGAGVDVDYASLANDRSSENFSSIRHGANETHDVWIQGQAWLTSRILRPVYQDWLASAMVLGQITFPSSGQAIPWTKYGRFAEAGTFQGRRWDAIQPREDAESNETLIALNLKSRTEICAGQGRDFVDVVSELTREKEMLDKAGLPSEVVRRPVGAPGTPPDDDGGGKPAKGGNRKRST